MGFYGNITNTNKTSFNFDKVYPNRYLMDQWATTDGVFLGRYVLVEYDTETKKEDYSTDGIYPEDSAEGKTNYEINFLIDKSQYGTTSSRLYDSTVWQKVYTDDGERYVMIAELNSVVPSLRLTIDKPTEGQPGVPYFSEESNNIDYQLHWEPQWGFKVGTIAFNKDGFNKDEANIEIANDSIYFTKAKSGTKYPVYATDTATGHKYIAYEEAADDIQILNINLPSIGNMVSQGYDIIYGENRDSSPSGSLKGYLDFFTTSIKSNEIPVRSSSGYLIGATLSGDEWINASVNSSTKQITVQHKDLTAVTDKTSVINLNDNASNSTISLYTPQIDAKGHVVGKTTTTVTLPYGYKTITTNGVNVNVDINATDEVVTDNIVADKAQDILAFNSGNKWVRINTDSANDTITIAHDVHTIDEVDATTTDLNQNASVNSLTIQDIACDEAGHITENKRHTYVLPYGFNKILPGPASSSTSAVASNTVAINADSTKDTLLISAGNKWLNVAGDDANNAFTMGHALASMTSDAKDDTSLDGVGSFTVQDLTFDEAGHVNGNQKHKYTLPNSIRNITINGASAFAATAYNSTLDLKNQDKWISLTTTDGAINIGHAAAGEEKTTVGSADNVTPSFGEVFQVPYLKYDEKGHIVSNGTHNVTLPKVSLTNTADITNATSTVLVGATIDENNGAISVTNKNVGTLLLTGYQAKDSVTGDISSADTINDAISKLRYYQIAEETRATNAENTIKSDFAAADTAIRAEFANADVAVKTEIKTTTDAITASVTAETDRAIAAEQANTTAIANETTARTEAINSINGEITALKTAPSASITTDNITNWNKQANWAQTDSTAIDFIQNKPDNLVTTDALTGMVTTSTEFIYTPAVTGEDGSVTTEAEKMTIQMLMDKVRQLESRISELEKEEVPEDSGTIT